MANFKPENVKRFVEDISKKVANDAYNGGGSGGTFVATGVNLSNGHRATINYTSLIEVLEANGINTSLTFEELYDLKGTVRINVGGDANPLFEEGYSKCTFVLDVDSGASVGFEGAWYMLPKEAGLAQSSIIRDAILSLPTEVEGQSEPVLLYPMPWFDIKNVE